LSCCRLRDLFTLLRLFALNPTRGSTLENILDAKVTGSEFLIDGITRSRLASRDSG
jgi:hypothetical protein